MTSLQEVLARRVPYSELSRDILVMNAIIQGRFPVFPDEDQECDDSRSQVLQKLCFNCWKPALDRPDMSEIVYSLTKQG